MLEVGERIPDAHVWLGPREPVDPARTRAPEAARARFLLLRLVETQPLTRARDQPFTGSTQWRRGKVAWEAAGQRGKPLSMHEARHSFVSLMHDAGFTLEGIEDNVGNSSAYMTDRYRRLLEGHEAEAAAKFDAYLHRVGSGLWSASNFMPT